MATVHQDQLTGVTIAATDNRATVNRAMFNWACEWKQTRRTYWHL